MLILILPILSVLTLYFISLDDLSSSLIFNSIIAVGLSALAIFMLGMLVMIGMLARHFMGKIKFGGRVIDVSDQLGPMAQRELDDQNRGMLITGTFGMIAFFLINIH